MRKYKIPKKDRKAWIEALESGKYCQGNGALVKGYSYCCLGVFGSIKGLDDEDMEGYNIPRQLMTHEFLFPKCLLGENTGRKSTFVDKLVDLNDGDINRNIQPKSFKKIAKYIRKHTVGV